jgi:hypothetical protein
MQNGQKEQFEGYFKVKTRFFQKGKKLSKKGLTF